MFKLHFRVSAYKKNEPFFQLDNWFAVLQTFSSLVPKWLRKTKAVKQISRMLVNHLGLTLTKENLESVVDLMEPYGQISNGTELLNPPLDVSIPIFDFLCQYLFNEWLDIRYATVFPWLHLVVKLYLGFLFIAFWFKCNIPFILICWAYLSWHEV